MKKRILFAAMLAVFPCIASATPLSQMQADAAAITSMSQTWNQLQTTAQQYAALAPYAEQEWAGQGPTVDPPFGGIEQCHNTHWDSVTDALVPGGMNIFGDAEAEGYAIQTVTVDFQTQLADWMTQQVQAGTDQAVVAQITAQNGALTQATNTLSSLLQETGNQVAAALSPGTALHQLPIQNWQAGIGNVPNLSAVQYIPGPNDGAPIGWSVQPASPLARLVDLCPTGTGSIPMLPLDGPVMANAQQAIADAPSMSTAIQPLENGSTWTLPGGGFPGLQDYSTREALVSALASDMTPLAGYMQPINQPLALYQQQVVTILNEVNGHA